MKFKTLTITATLILLLTAGIFLVPYSLLLAPDQAEAALVVAKTS